LDEDQLEMVPKDKLEGAAKIKYLLSIDINMINMADLLVGWSIEASKFKLTKDATLALPMDLFAGLMAQDYHDQSVT